MQSSTSVASLQTAKLQPDFAQTPGPPAALVSSNRAVVPMPPKKPPAGKKPTPSSPKEQHMIALPCPRCEALERAYKDSIAQIRELLEARFSNLGLKVRELRRFQETLLTPAGPCGPSGPWAPVAPCGPCGPIGPIGPAGPKLP